MALFQEKLLELLSQQITPAELKHKLLTDAQLNEFSDYVDTFDEDMVAVASELVKRWGRK